MKILLATQRLFKMGHTFKKQRTKFDDDMNSYKNKSIIQITENTVG